MDAKQFKSLPGWAALVVVVGLVGAVGFLRFGLTFDVTYKSARVVAVEPINNYVHDRFVTVLLDGGERKLRVSDHRIETTFGKPVCVKSSRRLMRRGQRLSIDLPFYCRKKALRQSTLADTAEAAYL